MPLKGIRYPTFDAVNLRTYISVAAANTSYTAWVKSLGKAARVKKIWWANRTGANGFLRIGYLNLNAAFVQVFPDIQMLTGFPDGLTEKDIGICGNSVNGFVTDTTPLTGTLGNIIVQASVGGASPLDVQVWAEIEET